MSGDKMDVEVAEEKMKTLEHSEQHYFKRFVAAVGSVHAQASVRCARSRAAVCQLLMTG